MIPTSGSTEGQSVPPPPSPNLKRSHSISNHPYAIKTTSTALLSRSNSTGQASHFTHSYSPVASTTSSRIVKGHKHTRSLSSLETPPPLPVPPSPNSPAIASSFSTGNLTDSEMTSIKSVRLKRSGTLPAFLTKSDTESTPPPKIDLPENPKFWTPSQLSIYLTTALRLKGGGSVPAPVAKDIAAFVVKEKLTGRAFVRLTDETLEDMGINQLWRDALLEASRTLRQDILKGRIFGFGSPPDHPRPKTRVPSTVLEQDENRFASIRRSRSGRVRGMVANFERAASQSSSSSRSSSPTEQRYETAEDFEVDDEAAKLLLAEDDDGFASGESSREPSLYEGQEGHVKSPSNETRGTPPPVYNAVAPMLSHPVPDPFDDQFVDADTTIRNDTIVLNEVPAPNVRVSAPIIDEDEPTMDDLLASGISDSWGAKAWEDADALIGNTARKLTQVVSPSRSKFHAPVTDLFDTKAPVPIQEELPVATVVVEKTEKEVEPSPLELLDVFRRRLEEVERKLEEMEVREVERDRRHREKEEREAKEKEELEKKAKEREIVLPPAVPFESEPKHISEPSLDSISSEPIPHVVHSEQSKSDDATVHEPIADPDRPVTKAPFEDPSLGGIPGYMLMVGLGVCLVVARVMIRRIGGKRA